LLGYTHRATGIDIETRPHNIDKEGFSPEGNYWPEDVECKCNYKLIPLAE